MEEPAWNQVIDSSAVLFAPQTSANSPGKKRIFFPYPIATYVKSPHELDKPHFNAELPLVAGRAALYGFWATMMRALLDGDDAHIFLLWQCGLTLTIRVLCTNNLTDILLYSARESENAVALKNGITDSFLVFGKKVLRILESSDYHKKDQRTIEKF